MIAGIEIPADAVVPVLAGIVILVVVVGVTVALIQWKRSNESSARVLGYVVGIPATIGTGLLAWQVVPETRHLDILIQGLPINTAMGLAATGALAGAFFKLAGQKWIGAVIAAGTAGALIAKPWVTPIMDLAWDSETHLFILVPGVVVAVIALLIAFTGRRS